VLNFRLSYLLTQHSKTGLVVFCPVSTNRWVIFVVPSKMLRGLLHGESNWSAYLCTKKSTELISSNQKIR